MSNGVVYKLYSKKDAKFYIGSCNNIDKRMTDHGRYNTSKKLNEWYEENDGYDNIKHKILKEYEEISKDDLRSIEDVEVRKHLTDNNCLNQRRVCLTEDEKGRDAEKEYERQHREKNKPIVKKQQEEYRKWEEKAGRKKEIDVADAASSKLYRERNPDYMRNWRDENRERISQQKKQTVYCPICDIKCTYHSVVRHMQNPCCLEQAYKNILEQI